MIMATSLVILISGNGSNLQAIIDAIAFGRLLNTSISLVISNKKDAYGLQQAHSARIDTKYLNLLSYNKKYPDSSAKIGQVAREAYDTDLATKVLEINPSLVICAGW